MIERIAIVLLGLAIAAAAGGIIWAVRRSSQKRARLAAVYDDRVEDTEPLPPDPERRPQANSDVQVRALEVRVRSIPPAPIRSPAVRQHFGYMSSEPLRPAYSARPSDILKPGAVLYGDPVPLGGDELTAASLFRADPAPAAPAADDGFKGDGGEFGGGGASGGWDGGSDTGSGGNEAA
jgi:hypothetical protein